MKSHVLIYVTCDSDVQAGSIAHILIEEKFAACANILPGATSIYKWQDQIQQEEEVILVLKTKASLFNKVQEVIKELHSYENPCIVALPIESGSAEFLQWIDDNTI